jgi:hypothetical protein
MRHRSITGLVLDIFPEWVIFLRKKTTKNRKSLTRADLIDLLGQGEVRFPPLTIARVERGVTRESGGQTTELDAIIAFRWGEREYAFAVECSRLWTPRAIATAADQALRLSTPPQFYPLVLAPYLPSAQLATLESRAVSGIDLCGNGVLVVPN